VITKARYLLPAAAALGFLAGFAAHRPKEAAPVVATPDSAPPPRPKRPPPASPAVDSAPTRPPVGMKSADTLDDLLAISDPDDLYARLALWQLDAPEEDLAAFWAAYRKRDKRDTGLVDLIFSQWTRTNPLAAIEAAKGSGHEGIPWWAWAVNDPDAAIAAVRGASKEMSGFVMRAVGQFHPERAMQVLEENPDFAQWNGIEGILNGLTRTDPEAALAFQRKHGRTHDTDAIEKLTREDPHAALEWLRAQPRGHDATSETAFLRTLERETPEMLAELAAASPSGDFKWKLESAAFRHLAATNPAEALAQARNAGSPRLAAERLAVIGKGLAESDPGKALEIFAELFKACPDAGNRVIWTRYPNGASGGGGAIDGVQPFIDGLVAADPQAAMAAATEGTDVATLQRGMDSSALTSVARTWARQDPAGFGGWLEGQEAGPLHDHGAVILASNLAEQGEFTQALDWSARMSDENSRRNSTQNAFQQWQSRDPDAATQWLEQAQLPEDLQKALEPYRRRR
jgi:hypothetical protein